MVIKIKVMKSNIVKLIEELFSYECNDVNDNMEDIKKEINRRHTINMIDDVESLAKTLTEKANNIDSVDLKNISIAFTNMIKFDYNDAKLVGNKETMRLITNGNIIRSKFHNIAEEILKHIETMAYRLNDEDNYENMTKEELIAKLREKK